ncbi:MAG: hypothetical protein JWN04_3756 [Myxococcaceae bacterium]|nr:hypothetical protein [Myxococcaceae bacterium]
MKTRFYVGLLLLSGACGSDSKQTTDAATPVIPSSQDGGSSAASDASPALPSDSGAAALADSGGMTRGDGGAPDAFGFEPSAELTKLLTQFALLRAGQPADLDGDGRPETELVKNGDGTSTFSSDQDGEGTPEFQLTVDPKGSSSMLVDTNRDGMTDEAVHVTVTDTTHTRVAQVDDNLNGKPDHRYTWTTNKATIALQAYAEETDLNETGSFSGPGVVNLTTTKDQAGSGCEGSDGFPSGGDGYQPFPSSPTIKSGSSPGSCSAADTSSIAQAVDCALGKGALCLASTNTREYNSLMAAALGTGTMPLDIGCGNACAGVIAATRGWGSPWFTNSTMNINAGEWNKLDSAGKCNIMLHEMLHWAGDQGSSDHNSESGAGDDAVYSCGRYCGGCSHAGHGSSNNSATDCAKCSDSPGRKEKCGVKSDFKTGPCNGELAGLCHSGLACISANCETCGQLEKKTCDDQPLETQATCCATCPSDCNKSNDLPCKGSPQSMDTCTDQTPPYCPKH